MKYSVYWTPVSAVVSFHLFLTSSQRGQIGSTLFVVPVRNALPMVYSPSSTLEAIFKLSKSSSPSCFLAYIWDIVKKNNGNMYYENLCIKLCCRKLMTRAYIERLPLMFPYIHKNWVYCTLKVNKLKERLSVKVSRQQLTKDNRILWQLQSLTYREQKKLKLGQSWCGLGMNEVCQLIVTEDGKWRIIVQMTKTCRIEMWHCEEINLQFTEHSHAVTAIRMHLNFNVMFPRIKVRNRAESSP